MRSEFEAERDCVMRSLQELNRKTWPNPPKVEGAGVVVAAVDPRPNPPKAGAAVDVEAAGWG